MDEFINQLIVKALEPIQSQLSYIIENMANLGQGKPVMNVREIAEYLGMSKSYIDKNVDEIPHFRLGSRILFNKEDIDKWRIAKANKPKEKVKISMYR